MSIPQIGKEISHSNYRLLANVEHIAGTITSHGHLPFVKHTNSCYQCRGDTACSHGAGKEKVLQDVRYKAGVRGDHSAGED